MLGISQLLGGMRGNDQKAKAESNGMSGANGTDGSVNGNGHAGVEKARAEPTSTDKVAVSKRIPWHKTLPALLFQVSMFQTMAGPIGFSALRHISYPTMVLGKVGPFVTLP